MDMARRSFLRGRPGDKAPPLRPPWALPEAEFNACCTRCGDCLPACPTGLLQKGPGNFPFADFSAAYCNFCGHCVDVCQPRALQRQITPPWELIAQIDDTCLARQQVVCRTCGETCEVGAIRFPPRIGGVAQPELSFADCTGCGECLSACPTGAITIGRRSAEEEKE